jgi:hypothetical protein
VALLGLQLTVMRIQYLRDVVAGCAGALLVLAVIGLPRAASSGTQLRVDPSSVSQCVPVWPTGTKITTPRAYVPVCYKNLRVPQVPRPPQVSVPQVKAAPPVPAQTH